MAKKKPAFEERKATVERGIRANVPAEPPVDRGPLSKAKAAVVHAAEQVADAAVQVAEAARDHVVTPVAEAVGNVEKKSAKKSRVQRTKISVVPPKPLPPRSRTVAGKMMSKNLVLPPKEKGK